MNVLLIRPRLTIAERIGGWGLALEINYSRVVICSNLETEAVIREIGNYLRMSAQLGGGQYVAEMHGPCECF
jgi:hypothetical protein